MRGTRVVRAAVVVCAALTVVGLSSCGADPHLQGQEARAMALTCHSLKERDQVTPVSSIPSTPFRKVIEDAPAATGGRTNRDLLVRVVCPVQAPDHEWSSLTFSFPFGDRKTATTTTTTAPTTTTTTLPAAAAPHSGPDRSESGTP